jgi:hypothetical protein
MSKHRLFALPLILIVLINLVAGTAHAAPVKPANPKFTEVSISLITGAKTDLTTKLKSSAKVAYLFTSSNAKIASVTAAGVVTGIAPGKATVTATVSQKGYSGKASIVIQVAAAAKSGSTANVSAKPVVYKDMVLLDTDIRKGLQTLYKKDYAKLTADEAAQRDKLMNIDRQQLLAGLQSLVIKAAPTWSASMVQDFAAHNLEGNIKDIAALFSKADSDKASQTAALEILKSFKTDKALKAFGNLLMSSADADLRYSLAYLISTFEGNSEALSILINANFKETDSKTRTNIATSLIPVAGKNPDMINSVILIYGQLPDAEKSQFSGFFAYDATRTELYKAWKTVLNDNLQSPVDALKNASGILLNDLMKYPHFQN